jgi:drug/metabolite transporter (DMT)-like permease
MSPGLQRLLAYGCLALSMSLVGSYVALSKPLVAAIPVFLLAWLRFGLGGLAMLHWLRKPANEPPLTTQIRQLVFLESFLGNFLFSICMLFGVSLSSAVSAGVIMASIPAVVAILSWAFLRERIVPRVWAAIALAATGMALLGLAQPTAPAGASAPSLEQRAWLGHLLLFGAVLCEAAYAVIGKKLTGVLGPKRITALINLWGFALVTPLGAFAAMAFDFGAVRPGTWMLLVFYALAASVWTVWPPKRACSPSCCLFPQRWSVLWCSANRWAASSCWRWPSVWLELPLRPCRPRRERKALRPAYVGPGGPRLQALPPAVGEPRIPCERRIQQANLMHCHGLVGGFSRRS